MNSSIIALQQIEVVFSLLLLVLESCQVSGIHLDQHHQHRIASIFFQFALLAFMHFEPRKGLRPSVHLFHNLFSGKTSSSSRQIRDFFRAAQLRHNFFHRNRSDEVIIDFLFDRSQLGKKKSKSCPFPADFPQLLCNLRFSFASFLEKLFLRKKRLSRQISFLCFKFVLNFFSFHRSRD